MGSNQFNSRVDLKLIIEYMERGSQRNQIKRYAEHVALNPGLCLVPDSDSYVYMRVASKLRKISIRSLVYYAVHGKSPTFWQCGCKNKGCINPNHQMGDGL